MRVLGGRELRDDWMGKIRNGEPMTGESVVTAGGNLMVRSVIHLAIPKRQQHGSSSSRLEECLKKAVNDFPSDVLSIAIPLEEFHDWTEVNGVFVKLLQWINSIPRRPSRIIFLCRSVPELSHLLSTLTHQLSDNDDSEPESLPAAGNFSLVLYYQHTYFIKSYDQLNAVFTGAENITVLEVTGEKTFLICGNTEVKVIKGHLQHCEVILSSIMMGFYM